MNELEKLSEYIVNLKLDDVPTNVREAAKVCVLDSFAVAVGASKDELIESIVMQYKSLYPQEDKKSLPVWGHDIKLPLVQAVFVNSLMSHRLELDDVHTNSKTHLGTVVVPVAICLAIYLNSSPKEFIEAIICAYETMSRIGMGFGVSAHRNKGWHVTSTAGTFGAAAAASKLLKLNYTQTTHALGMAGTQSFGLWAFLEDSASSKILHPARAAASGLEAAFLAKAGMSGPRSILNALDGSLFKAMSDEYNLSLVTKGLGKEYEILNLDNKPYPCCRSTHCTIDSGLYLKNNYNIDTNNIEKIEVDTYLVGYKQCGLTEGSKNPKTPVEAKFSTPYTISVALIDGNVTLEHFKAETISNENIQSLLKKVIVRPNDEYTNSYPEHWGCKTKITMKNGSEFEVEIKDALGSIYNPIDKDGIKSKVVPLLRVYYNDDKIIEKILDIEKYDNLMIFQ